MADGRIPLASPDHGESPPPAESKEEANKRKAVASPGTSPGYKAPPKKQLSGIPKGTVQKTGPK